MRKLEVTGRKFLATLMAAVMLLIMLPITLIDTAEAANYTQQDDAFYFWDEQGLREIIAANAESEYFRCFFAASQDALEESGTELTITDDLTIPAAGWVNMREGQLTVAEGKTLTLEGVVVTLVSKPVIGVLVLSGEHANYCKAGYASSETELAEVLDKMGRLAADSGDIGTEYSVDITEDVSTGDLEVPADVYLYIEVDCTLDVKGTLRIKQGGDLTVEGTVNADSIVVEQGGGLSMYGEMYFGTALTLEAELRNGGVIAGGDAARVTVGTSAVLTNYGMGTISAKLWTVDSAATVTNYGVFKVPVEKRGQLTAGEKICYNADSDGSEGTVHCEKVLTDTKAAVSGALQSAIDSFNSLSDKRDYEWFVLGVRNAEEGAALQLTLSDSVTVNGALDQLAIMQGEWPEDMTGFTPCFTVAEGAVLTLAQGYELTVNVPTVINGTLDLQNNGGMIGGTSAHAAFYNDLTINGVMHQAGVVELYGTLLIAAGGSVDQTLGRFDVDGTLALNGTLRVEEGTFTVRGEYIKAADATLTIEEYGYFTYEAKTTFDVDKIEAALARENVQHVIVALDKDVVLDRDLTIPQGGKRLIIENEGGTLTIAAGTVLTLEKYTRGEDDAPPTGSMGGGIECSAPLVIEGTLSAEQGTYTAIYNRTIISETGRVNMEGEMGIGGQFVVKEGGHVTNNGWVDLWGEALPVMEAGWDSAWTQGADATVRKGIDQPELQAGDNAAEKIQTVINGIDLTALPGFVTYNMYVSVQELTGNIELTQDMTIPAGLELDIWGGISGAPLAIHVAEGATLTVNGALTSGLQLFVDGTMIVNGKAYARDAVAVGGTLTVNAGGSMSCRSLTDENAGKAGTIIRSGKLCADSSDLRHNDLILDVDDGRKAVRTLETLEQALKDGGEIAYRADALTIDHDMTIPEGVDLLIEVNTFTISAGATLTNLGNVQVNGDAYFYGKLDVSSWRDNNIFYGKGVICAGSYENIIGDENGNRNFDWSSLIKKTSAKETLTTQELTAAVANEITKDSDVIVQLGTQTCLILEGDVEVRQRVQVNGGRNARIEVGGTLTVWRSMTVDMSMTVNGTVDVYGDLHTGGNIYITSGGKLHVYDEVLGNRWIGRVQFWGDAWVQLPEDGVWDEYVTVDGDGTVFVFKHTNITGLEKALKDCADGRTYVISVAGNGQQNSAPLTVTAGTTLTIPQNVTLQINEGNRISKLVIEAADGDRAAGELIIKGELLVWTDVIVNGVLTISGNARLEGKLTEVNGTMTIQEDASAFCSCLGGKGSIVNNGALSVGTLMIGTTVTGEGKYESIDGNRSMIVSKMEDLKTALAMANDPACDYTITIQRGAVDEDAPDFVLSESITIPDNMTLDIRRTENSGFRGFVVAQGVTLEMLGTLHVETDEGMTIAGTVLAGRAATESEQAHGCCLVANAVMVQEGGKLVNNGYVQVYRLEDTMGVALYSAETAANGTLVVRGTMENRERIDINDGTIIVDSTGKLTNGGNMHFNGSSGVLAVNGQMENQTGAQVNCNSLQYSGSAFTNAGSIGCVSLQHSGGSFTNTGDLDAGTLDIADDSTITNEGHISYEDCDTLERIENTDTGDIQWYKVVTTIKELRELLARTGEGNVTLRLQDSCNVAEDLTIPQNIGLFITAERAVTLCVAESRVLTVNSWLIIDPNCTFRVVGKLGTSGAAVNGTIEITESGEWINDGGVEVYTGEVQLNGTLTQMSENSYVRAHYQSDGGSGRIVLNKTAQWNGPGQIGGDYSGCVSGFDPNRYELRVEDGNYYVLRQMASTVGDVNGDGIVDEGDLRALARHVAGIESLKDLSNADINGDGFISAADLTALARILQSKTTDAAAQTVDVPVMVSDAVQEEVVPDVSSEGDAGTPVEESRDDLTAVEGPACDTEQEAPTGSEDAA